MDLQWRPGTRHQLPDALSRLPCSESPGEDINEAFPDDTSSRQTYRGPEGPVLDGVPLKELGANQVDEPKAESVVAVAGTAITPEDVADNVEGAAQILLCPRSSKSKTEDNGFGMGDGESFEGLASLEEIGGVTRAVTRALSRATSQSLPAPTPQQPRQQPQPMEEDSTLSRREGATEVNEQNRTHPTILAETADILQNSRLLEEKKRRDATLESILAKLDSGEIGGGYLLDDEGLLWYAPKGADPKLAIPRVLVPGVLALVHSTFGHPGVARTTLLVQGKYTWSTLIKDVREYVFSCGCRRRKRANSQRVAMMPAKFLRPWEVLEMDIQDLKQESQDGNRYLLVVVDRASKFLFAYPLPSKDAVGVSRKLLEVILTFGVPLSIRSDAGGEFTAQVVKNLCQWLRVSIDYGPANHPGAQGAVERMGGWLQEVMSELRKSWPRIWDRYVLPACWIQRVTPDPSLPSSPTPFRLLFGRDARTQ